MAVTIGFLVGCLPVNRSEGKVKRLRLRLIPRFLGTLDPPSAFTSLALFNGLIAPLNALPWVSLGGRGLLYLVTSLFFFFWPFPLPIACKAGRCISVTSLLLSFAA